MTLTRMKPAALFATVAVSAVTASVGMVAPPAFADQGYPSWDDVAKAKQNEATKKAQIEELTALLDGLQTAAAEASKASQIAAEMYRVTQDQLDAATLREASLVKQTDAARARARTSKMRAGLIAAHLAKTGAQDLSLNLFLNGNGAGDLLHQLGTATKLGEQSETIYREALQDANTADSLGMQAASATIERKRLTEESQTKFERASGAAQAAQSALATEQKKSNELYEQLALLKDTTAEAEREYQTGLDAAAAAAAFAQAQADAAVLAREQAAAAEAARPPQSRPQQSRPPQSRPEQSRPEPSKPTQAKPTQAKPAPVKLAPVKPAPVKPRPAAPAPSGSGSSEGASSGGYVPVPNASAVETAMAFARDQLGERYVLGGYGPNVWDCSGLTKAAYDAAGIYIGSHSATDQYWTMANQGRLVPFSQARAGDLLFWSSGYDYYHVALYVGGGQVLEAADVGKPVRIHSIWGYGDLAPYVGRPSG